MQNSAAASDAAVADAVRSAARAARSAVASLASAPDAVIDEALRAMAAALEGAAPAILAANAQDMQAAAENGLPAAMRDRLKLDDARLRAMASQLEILAGVRHEPLTRKVRDLAGGLVVRERRRPVGVVGANFEARPNVTIDVASQLVESSVDRLGVCNRLNLLLIDRRLWDEWLPEVTAQLAALGIEASLPPHEHPLGYEWALDAGREATVTIAPADSPAQAAAIANDETSGLAAGIAASDRAAAAEFLDVYAGTGAFWKATTRLLDGFQLLRGPGTRINIEPLPG